MEDLASRSLLFGVVHFTAAVPASTSEEKLCKKWDHEEDRYDLLRGSHVTTIWPRRGSSGQKLPWPNARPRGVENHKSSSGLDSV